MRRLGVLALVLMHGLMQVTPISAQEVGVVALETSETETESESDTESATESDAESDDLPSYGATGVVRRAPLPSQATSTVTRDEMRERLARSAPDALRYTPGVSVQQTTHGQGSPYIRGLTGQQVLLMFDGVRLNNGVYRQGPNQYFFTIDAAVLDRIEVIRGSASTRLGSDAMGGAVLAVAAEPTLDPTRSDFSIHSRAIGRFGSQDLDAGGRLEVDAQLTRDVAILIGGGYRAAQSLQGSGILTNPSNGRVTLIPFVESDGRTQRGTGFRYGTFDGRLVVRVAPELRFIAAVYGFRQYDTPRADQCPPPTGSERDCTVMTEQFRTLAYVALRGSAGPDLREVDLTLSYQRQHERRELRQPSTFARNDFIDDLDTLGLSVRLGSRRYALGSDVGFAVRAGGELYGDALDSSAFFSDTLANTTAQYARGLYADGAQYYTGGAFLETEVDVFRALRVRSGIRLGLSGVRIQSNAEAGTQFLRRDFAAPVARVGLEWLVSDEVSLLLNIDQGFRAPNLDDLTSRQIIGPGFQFENPALTAERSTTYELGARARTGVLDVDAWVYAMDIEGSMVRAPRSLEDCPQSAPECRAAFSRFQLINAEGTSWMLGAELSARLTLPFGLGALATVSYAWGEGPSPLPMPMPNEQRVPLSRVPPLNGTLELRYAHEETHLVIGAAMRWATMQDRLAIQDRFDARIPLGGTPAYATFDLRAGWRFEHHLQLSAVFENVFDQVYRVHGSGINGPGRGLVIQVEGAL